MREVDPSRNLVAALRAPPAIPAGVTARDLAAVVFRRQRVILTVFCWILLTAALGAIWIGPRLSPARYASSLKFMIKKDRFDAVVTSADRAVPGITTAVSPQEVQSEIELLKSADVLEGLAAEAQAPLERLRESLQAEPVIAGRNVTSWIAVRYTAPDRGEVARVLAKLPEVYLQKHLRMNGRPEALEYFRSQAEAGEEELQAAETALAEFRKDEPPLAAEARQQPALLKLAEVERQRIDAEAAIRETESRVAELARQLSEIPAVLLTMRPVEESPYLGRLKTQLLELENQRALATYHRDIEKLDARVAEVRQAITAESEAAGTRASQVVPNPARGPLEAEHRQTQVQLAGLRSRRAVLAVQERVWREELSAAHRIAVENGVETADLLRAVKTAEENAQVYRRKYAEAREADLLDQKRVVNVVVAEGARPPEPVPSRSLGYFLAIGLLAAAGGGAAAGLAAERLDHSLHTPLELERCTAAPVLACIPHLKDG